MVGISMAAKPRLDSGFVQMDISNASWSANHWAVELANMKSVGINTVIISTSCYLTTAYYPGCSLAGVTSFQQPLEKILNGADSTNMKIILGLYYDADWWTLLGDTTYLAQLYQKDSAVFNDLWSLYSTHPSIMGWYLVQETDNNMYKVESYRQRYVNYFLKPITDYIKTKAPATKISVAPYFYPAGDSAVNYGNWWVKTFTEVPNLDILMPQDGVGAGGYPYSFVTSYFKELKRACDSTNRSMWSDLEIFDNTSTWGPTPISRVTTQLAIEQPYVQAFTCWEYSYYLSPLRGVAEDQLHSDYLEYLYGTASGYSNIAKGKSYTVSPTPTAPYPDDTFKLTDETTAFNYPNSIGWWNPASRPVIVLDLGTVKNDIFELRGYSMFSYTAAVDTVSYMVASTSNDGINYTFRGNLTALDTVDNNINIYLWNGAPIAFRYLKLTLIPSSTRWVFINEVVVKQHKSIVPINDWYLYDGNSPVWAVLEE